MAKRKIEESEVSDSDEIFDTESEEDESMMETSEDEEFIPVSNLFHYYSEKTD